MDFGKWVQELRRQNTMDVRIFAERTGVDPSTISRIENLRTQATILTAFRICESMEISPEQLLQGLNGQEYTFLQPKNFSEESHPYQLTLETLDGVINNFVSDEKGQRKYLSSLLNAIEKVLYKKDIYEKESHRITTCPDDINRLIFISPLFSPQDIKYPVHLSEKHIASLYRHKGVIIPEDAENYVDKIRTRGYNRLSTSTIDRLKLTDVIQFDHETEQNGIVIGMYWEACRFYEHFNIGKTMIHSQTSMYSSNSPIEIFTFDWKMRLATLYVTIFRWMQFLEIKPEVDVDK